MLAYVFWHRPDPGRTDAYEAALAAFHRTLRGDAPPGFCDSAALRLDAAPWLEGEGVAYEDWYLVDDWAALGALNAHAAAGARAPAHDAVAHAAAEGAGAVYKLVSGPPTPPNGGLTHWLSKPSATPYAAFHEELRHHAGQAWQRQMVLGPAPEYAVLGGTLPWPSAERRFEAVA